MINIQQFFMVEPSKKGEQTRQQLILAAFDLFAVHGLEGTSTRQIASKAKQNISAIAYYFNSKEGLYLAVAEWLADFIRLQFSELFTEIDKFLASQPQHDHALEYIKKIIRLHCRLLTDAETVRFTQFILREQLSPTDALDVMHEKAFLPLHQRLTLLVGCYIGSKDNEIPNILHAHVLIGNVLAFRMGQELLLARTQWEKLSEEHVVMIENTIIEQAEFALLGLRNKNF